ncbi:hypothetical protein Ct9H90mP29_05730 [bacterium]|nr:MAG: hypothetical protein Ct9H90mP29_05730 [bacterium]
MKTVRFLLRSTISDNQALQTAPRVKKRVLGEVFVNWKDLRDDPIDGDQYFQKINTKGKRAMGRWNTIRSSRRC